MALQIGSNQKRELNPYFMFGAIGRTVASNLFIKAQDVPKDASLVAPDRQHLSTGEILMLQYAVVANVFTVTRSNEYGRPAPDCYWPQQGRSRSGAISDTDCMGVMLMLVA